MSTSNHPRPAIQISLAGPKDVATLYEISLQAFTNDIHTLFKLHEKGLGLGDMSVEMPNELDGLFDADDRGGTKGVLLKALRQDTGEIVGMSGWRWWNRYGKKAHVAESQDATADPISYPTLPASSTKLDRLSSRTSAHLFTLFDRFCSPRSKGLYCIGISVHPSAQGLGVGTAMVQEAARMADAEHAGMWVHLSDSDAGQRAFEKNGFQVWPEVGLNEVDLDEYCERGMPEGRQGQRWGKYCFRCLVRDAM